MSENAVNIVFCINSKFSRYLYVQLSSILRHSKENIHFYIIYSSLDDKAKEYIVNILSSYKHAEFNVDFIYVDIKKLLESKFNNIRLRAWFGSYDIYNRLFLNEILKETGIKTIISMDADMIILYDLSDLYDLYRTTKTIRGLPEKNPCFKRHVYLNAGLLILDLDFLDQINFAQKAICMINNEKNKFLYPEQDIINFVIDDDLKQVMSERFNEMNSSKNFIEERTVVLHYVGRNKPWRISKSWNHAKILWFKEKYIANKMLKNIVIDEYKVDMYFKLLEIILCPFFFVINSIRYVQSTIKKLVKKFRLN